MKTASILAVLVYTVAAISTEAPRNCSLHLREWAYKGRQNIIPHFSVEVSIFDNTTNKDGTPNRIGLLERTGRKDDLPISVTSTLKDQLLVRPEERNDYVAFELGRQKWPSNKKYGPDDTHNECKVGAWDDGRVPSTRDMDCWFSCE